MVGSMAVDRDQGVEIAPMMAGMVATLVVGAAAQEDLLVPFLFDMKWIDPDGNEVVRSEDTVILREGLTSFLQLQPVQQSHEGRYTCQAIFMETNLSATSFVDLDQVIGKQYTA